MIYILDFITFILSVISIVIILLRWKNIVSFDLKFLTLALLVFNVLYASLLFVEWYEVTKSFDKLEDIIGALIPMLWAFLFYSFIQNSNKQIIKKNEEFRKRIFESSKIPIVIMNSEYSFIDCNQAAVDIFAFKSKNETIGKTPIDISDEYQYDGTFSVNLAKKYIEQSILKGFIQFEWRHKRPNGEIWDAFVTLMSFISDNQQFFQFTLDDISNDKKNEIELENHRHNLENLVNEKTEELSVTIDKLNLANEVLINQKEELVNIIQTLQLTQKKLIQSEKLASLGLLSAGIAHEINNPLNFIHGGIVGIDNYINEHVREHESSLRPLLYAIHTGVKRASEIVASLSHYNRKNDLPFIDCNIHEIIDNCLVMLQNKLKNKVKIQKHFSEKTVLVFGNEGKLHQVFINILSNAEQAIEEKGTITIKSESTGDFLIISVNDTGNGIKKEHLQKIFDPFFTTKEPGKGTGLGLSITYSIIQEHNGIIEIDSEEGKGTTITIRFPINTNSYE